MKRNEATGRIREKTTEVQRKILAIPFLAGRPTRDSVICPDDLINLKIALATCSALDDFLQVT